MRVPLSKKIRFEVFKRDKFTCQYCGEKSPNVVLNVDHIEAVANGGTNEIVNLITSCFECNNGKRAIPLGDDSAIEKQRKQLEHLQERREQIELMFEWKKSLSELDAEVNAMIASYINSKMEPWSVKDGFKTTIQTWLKKFALQDILDAIDISADKYLLFDGEGTTHESVENFLGKIDGVLHNKSQSPIQQKIAYIKGIAKNRFDYWNNQRASIILSNYVKALKQHWTDEQILDDLQMEVEMRTKQVRNWREWTGLIEGWTTDINEKWVKPEMELSDEPETNSHTHFRLIEKDYTYEELTEFVFHINSEQNDQIQALEHIISLFPEYERDTFKNTLQVELLNFLKNANDFDKVLSDEEELSDFIEEYINKTSLINIYSNYIHYEGYNFGVLFALEKPAHDLLISIFRHYYFPKNIMKREHAERLLALHIEDLSNQLSSEK